MVQVINNENKEPLKSVMGEVVYEDETTFKLHSDQRVFEKSKYSYEKVF